LNAVVFNQAKTQRQASDVPKPAFAQVQHFYSAIKQQESFQGQLEVNRESCWLICQDIFLQISRHNMIPTEVKSEQVVIVLKGCQENIKPVCRHLALSVA
jgi:hypothetical protein